MGIIRRDQAENISMFSFAQRGEDGPAEQEWALPELGAGAPPEPSMAMAPPEQGGETLAIEAQPDTPVGGEELPPGYGAEPSAAPSTGTPFDPVFEIPEDLLQAFYEQAIGAGVEDGRNQAMSELGIWQERFAGALDQLIQVSEQLEANNRAQLISLGCKIAEKLVRNHFTVHPEHLLGAVSEVLSAQEQRGEVMVQCGQHDFEYLTSRRQELVDGVGGSFSVKVILNPELEIGDFTIETAYGQTDGRVSSRMEEVEQALSGEDEHV